MSLSRRRFLTIAAGSAAVAAVAGVEGARAQGLYRWRGSALGAEAEMLLPVRGAGPAIDAALTEIERLEAILSLYRPNSALSRLNRHGRLDAPPPELVEVLAHGASVSRITGGVFDVTVQPLWELYAATPAPDLRTVADALARVNWRAVEVSPAAIRFRRAGMRATLNGIAQGYVSDRIADLLRARGYDHVLVDIGEVRALGPHPSGRPWQVSPGRGVEPLEIAGGALATSAPVAGDGLRHLFDPASGRRGGQWRSVTAAAATAMHADALSTALALMDGAAAASAFQRSQLRAAWLRPAEGAAIIMRHG